MLWLCEIQLSALQKNKNRQHLPSALLLIEQNVFLRCLEWLGHLLQPPICLCGYQEFKSSQCIKKYFGKRISQKFWSLYFSAQKDKNF